MACAPSMSAILSMALHLMTFLLMVTSSAVTSAKRREVSHLEFYMVLEEELAPQVKVLADRVLGILTSQCTVKYDSIEECRSAVQNLPAIPVLENGSFPSENTMEKEWSTVFIKRILKDVHFSLYKLEAMLDREESGFLPLTVLTGELKLTRLRLQQQMEKFFKVNLRTIHRAVRKSKDRYMRQSRSGAGDCQPAAQHNDCLTQDDYRLRLLHVAQQRLTKVRGLLKYVVRLSWLNLQNGSWPSRSSSEDGSDQQQLS